MSSPAKSTSPSPYLNPWSTGPSLAAQIPGGISANFLGQSSPCQSPLGQFLLLFESPPTRDLQPASLHFPRGNGPRARRRGGFPRTVASRIGRDFLLPLATPPNHEAAATTASVHRHRLPRRRPGIRPPLRHPSTSLSLGLPHTCDVHTRVALRRSSTAAT